MKGPIKFTIIGNQEDESANPIPYLRMTQNSHWTKKAQRYGAWKDFVRWSLIDAAPDTYAIELKKRMLQGSKPIDLGKGSANMKIHILWAKANHGDPDNIWKGISDALFQNDKEVAGSFDYKNATDHKGRVEVEITYPQ